MNVKIARIKVNMTQTELCKMIHMSPNKLVKVEKGDYSTLTKNDMEKIATALNSSVQELFFN